MPATVGSVDSDLSTMSNEAQKDLIVGIDLGTTNSLVSVVDSGFPIVLADQDGDRIQPSVVCFDSPTSATVGKTALRSLAVKADRTISSIKRIIGRQYSALSELEILQLPFEIQSGKQGKIEVLIGDGNTATAVEVTAKILEHLKAIAESALEESVERCVITVPAYFNHAQREATRQAAELAGWTVERILNEPTAAALAYGLDKGTDGQVIAVYDLGGGTFDLSILELNEGLFEVVATAGDTALGGDDIDRAVVEWMLQKFELDESQLDQEHRARLHVEARKAKERLSDADTIDIELPFFFNNQSFTTQLKRAELDQLALPFLERTRVISQQAILEAKHKGKGNIDHLILVGGSTRLPLVREKLAEWLDIEPNLSQNPDESVAIGAGIQAGILCGRVKQVILIDVVPLSLGIETFGGLMNILIPRNSTIPSKAGELFTNGVANQESMVVRVLQGEREKASDNWLLGEVIVPFEPGPKGHARVGVQFTIDENGMLSVLVRDTKTGEDKILEIQNAAVDVTDEAVENMVSESIEHAFDDMEHRQVTEALMKSRELLPAVEAALAMVGDNLDESVRSEILEAAAAVKQLSERDSPPLTELKAANATLDDKTQTLASILVEQALDGSFG